MKPELNDQDKSDIEWQKKTNPVLRWFRMRDTVAFQVGDVLIKEELVGKNWRVVPVSEKSDVPKKYMYIHEDEFGIGYVRQLAADGLGFVGRIHCIAGMNLDAIKFQVDPDYAEHILLSEDDNYDYGKKHRELLQRREEVRTKNKQARRDYQRFNTQEMFDKLRMGEEFWMTEGLSANRVEHYKVVSFLEYKENDVVHFNPMVEYDDNGVLRKKLLDARYNSWGMFFKTKPFTVKDIL